MGSRRWGIRLPGPEGASLEERRFGTGPSFVRMTEGRAKAAGNGGGVLFSAHSSDTSG